MSIETPVQRIISALSSPEHDRTLCVADLLFQVESYALNGSMALSGLMLKHPDAARDIFATKQMLDELATWAKGLSSPLYAHIGIAPAGSPEQNLH